MYKPGSDTIDTYHRFIALIPARGGSKGIANKNLSDLNGQPLIAYSIQAATKSNAFTHVIVSSDSQEILKVAKRFGAERLERNPSFATDEAPMDPVIAEVIEAARLRNDDVICLLQPTSPIRTADHIVDALALFNQSDCDAVISVHAIDNKVLKAYVIDPQSNSVLPIHSAETSYQRRQDLPEVVMPNGAMYIFSVAAFKRQNGIPRSNITPFLMTAEESADVDSPEDMQYCASLLNQAAGGHQHASF
ncbi:acylneuraminate cytidylyltransferase family protein [Aurantivibrio plasticivorans]